MDIREIRLQRLLALLGEHNGKRGDLATRIGKSPSQLSQWLSRYRTITEDTARDIEAKARKPPGWMDDANAAPLAPQPPPPPLAAALPVVLAALPGLDDYTADKVLTALRAAMRSAAPLDVIERDLIALLGGQPGKRQAAA